MSSPEDNKTTASSDKLHVTHAPSLEKRSIINLSIIGVIILLCVVGYFLYRHNQDVQNQKSASLTQASTQPYYQYLDPNKLVSQKFAGPAAGQGMSLQLPAYFMPADTNHPDWKAFYDNYVNKSGIAIGVVGTAYVFSNPYSSTNAKPDSATLVKDMADTKSAFYIAQAKAATDLVNKYYITNNITMTGVHRLGSTNAWVYNFNAPLKPTVKPKATSSTPQPTPASTNGKNFNASKINPAPLPDFKGEIVYYAGNNGSYYFLTNMVYYNFDKNSYTWQKVINSIKVDQ